MFGFSLSEMLLLAVIALVVIGPKQLPEVARTLGRFLNELKRTSNSFTREFRDNMDKAKVDPVRYDNAKPTDSEPSVGPKHASPVTAEATGATVTPATFVSDHATPSGKTDSHD